MNDYERMYEGWSGILAAMAIAIVVLFPLGIWKLVEIAIWIFQLLRNP